jgi:hypothetical protein
MFRNVRNARVDLFSLQDTTPVVDWKYLRLQTEAVLIINDIGRMPVVGERNTNHRHRFWFKESGKIHWITI